MRLVNFSFVWWLRSAGLANQPPARKYVHGGKNLVLSENNFWLWDHRLLSLVRTMVIHLGVLTRKPLKHKSNESQCSGLMRLVNFSFVWRLRPAGLANQPPARKYMNGGKIFVLSNNNFWHSDCRLESLVIYLGSIDKKIVVTMAISMQQVNETRELLLRLVAEAGWVGQPATS